MQISPVGDCLTFLILSPNVARLTAAGHVQQDGLVPGRKHGMHKMMSTWSQTHQNEKSVQQLMHGKKQSKPMIGKCVPEGADSNGACGSPKQHQNQRSSAATSRPLCHKIIIKSRWQMRPQAQTQLWGEMAGCSANSMQSIQYRPQVGLSRAVAITTANIIVTSTKGNQ